MWLNGERFRKNGYGHWRDSFVLKSESYFSLQVAFLNIQKKRTNKDVMVVQLVHLERVVA